MPNFIEIGQTSLEIGGCRLGLGRKINFVTDGQKRDYLSRASQCARGATKNRYIIAPKKIKRNNESTATTELKKNQPNCTIYSFTRSCTYPLEFNSFPSSQSVVNEAL